MSQQIRLVFPTLEADAIATLLDREAPESCAALWQAIAQPCDGVLSAPPDAPVARLPLPPLALEPENDDTLAIPGDVFVCPDAGGAHGATLAVAFARAKRSRPEHAAVSGNRVAVVTQNLSVVQQAAQAASSGPVPVRVERAEPCAMPSMRDGIIQVGLVVENVEQSAAMWWELFGIGPWKVYNYGRPRLKFLSYHGEPADFHFRIALAWVGPLCIELIEPGEGPSIYHDFGRQRGYGLHHLAVGVDDMQRALAQAAASGLTVTQEGGGQGLDGSGHFAYLDSDAKMDAIVELVEFPRKRVRPDKMVPPRPSSG